MAARTTREVSFFLLSFLSLCFALRAASQTLSNDEKRILLQIKREWRDQPVLASWNDTTTSSYCAWTGVGCAADGSVVNITFYGQTTPKISQPIPNSLCSLRNLTYLDLSYNNIPGSFPTSLYNCSSLRYLDLSQNRFVGVIPDDVDRLSPLLTHLDLSSNNFSGDVPPAISRFPAIQKLVLNSNLFNGSFPAEIGNLSRLQTLMLAYNPFAPNRIPPDFGNLTQLVFLWMTSANLVGEIPPSFSKLEALMQLDLAENSLTGTIPAGIWALPNLVYLFLYKNNLSGPITIDGTIGALGLERIDVSMNQINGSIPKDFGKLPNLSVLFMYYNRLSGEIPASVGLLPSLFDLRLFNNGLTGVLPPELGRHSPLWNIEVDDNRISGELPEGLCDGGALTSIVVFNNNMSGKIPPSLGSCSTLDNIQVQSNRFSGEVPDGIWSAVNLTTVIMRDNAFSGGLPDKLPWNLTRLDIKNNRFSGQVPSSAGNLVVFLASNNMFSGNLPSTLTGLSRLQSLSLGGNMITGTIPSDLSVLKSLVDLNLSHNQLTGHIPVAIGSLPVLNSLDLSANELSGSIPTAMANLKLNFLNLSSNQLSGEIPAGLQSPAYEQSFLSNPSLCAANSQLNVPACRRGSSGGLSRGLRILFFVLGGLVFLMALAFSVFVYRDRKKRSNGSDPAVWNVTSFQSVDFTESNIMRGIKEENLIGSGGSGNVYKVDLGNRAGETVAVKKIWSSRKLDSKLEKQFQSEVKFLGSIRHKNIIKLRCCISSPDSKLLVYEYMGNGSLDRWLHGKRAAPLHWSTRLEIAVGSARGLCYLHHDCSPPIIHRDVKSSNILLDMEFNAKIADFGLARMLVKPGQLDTVSVIAGSFGYMAPECGYSRRLNEKVDVYSFGVVLLELTTGRQANNEGEQCNLAEWAWKQIQEGANLRDAVDPAIKDSPQMDDITTVFKLGLRCTESLPSRRPSMKDVLQVLMRCNRPRGDDCKPCAERDVAPLLSSKTGSRRKGSPNDGDEKSLACNV
ncbi:receptor-like protein kinase HSL1 [Musa acuminata AAA Group]|uniref:receptor-like protein kinase HSL1 n=1 Tax=Musa acuminata AAA Group TaxID=214697 RepID=UPI0031E006AF